MPKIEDDPGYSLDTETTAYYENSFKLGYTSGNAFPVEVSYLVQYPPPPAPSSDSYGENHNILIQIARTRRRQAPIEGKSK